MILNKKPKKVKRTSNMTETYVNIIMFFTLFFPKEY